MALILLLLCTGLWEALYCCCCRTALVATVYWIQRLVMLMPQCVRHGAARVPEVACKWRGAGHKLLYTGAPSQLDVDSVLVYQACPHEGDTCALSRCHMLPIW